MREAEFQSKLTRWTKYNLDHSCAIEAKITKTKRLPLSNLAPHQRLALRAVKHGTLAWKLADTSYTQLPFDMFVLKNAQAYIAVMFYQKGCRHFYLIDIDAWDAFSVDHKSITEEEAGMIGIKHITPQVT